jgi:hypothetical protein
VRIHIRTYMEPVRVKTIFYYSLTSFDGETSEGRVHTVETAGITIFANLEYRMYSS